MMTSRFGYWSCAAVSLLSLTAALFAASPSNPLPANSPEEKAKRAKITAELKAGDAASVADAENQIRGELYPGHVPLELRHFWLPLLMKLQRYQDAADFALVGANDRPANGLSQMMQVRATIFLKLNQPDTALQAAKSDYNVSDLNRTGDAIDLVGLCLSACHPDDTDIVRRFRNEQALASTAGPADETASSQPSTQPASMLKSITIDESNFADGLKYWQDKTSFDDMTAYGDLLLAADRGSDAEKIFRQLYQLAATQAQLNLATAGIAQSLRAEDGNLARANACLEALQAGNSTTKPAESSDH